MNPNDSTNQQMHSAADAWWGHRWACPICEPAESRNWKRRVIPGFDFHRNLDSIPDRRRQEGLCAEGVALWMRWGLLMNGLPVEDAK